MPPLAAAGARRRVRGGDEGRVADTSRRPLRVVSVADESLPPPAGPGRSSATAPAVRGVESIASDQSPPIFCERARLSGP
ncbi:unnamed protein product [Angiostrongylus costaricensis]|uniref:Uncharacterized protein n=1 Tax=Angiostrongylus costaricensis TaxID=334426 RepID=A0A0R3PZ88_ANGCS|nr:unnamed protein product [Angiostrongylus costaricensis]